MKGGSMYYQVNQFSQVRQYLLVFFVSVLLFTTEAFALNISQLKNDLTHYQEETAKIVTTMGSPAGFDPLFVGYLSGNQASANSLHEFVSVNRSELAIVRQIELFNKNRILMKDRLNDVLSSASKEWLYYQQEDTAWRNDILPYLGDVYIEHLVIRKKLYELKYFEEDDPESASIVEGWLNGSVPFTRYKDENAWYRQDGVSKWEASLRVEPLVLLEDDNKTGVLLAGGLLYNFFPLVSQSNEDKFQAITKDDNRSKYLKRTGLKVGAGAMFDDPKTEFLAGLGFQMRACSLWGVYSTGDSSFSLAVSLSDWDWVKKTLPFFE